MNENELWHYGTPRHSGRYPYGSGENPYQHEVSFMRNIRELRAKGLSETQIAKSMNMNTAQLRKKISSASAEIRAYEAAEAIRLRDKGMGYSAIAARMGKNESSIRSLCNPILAERAKLTKQNADILRNAVDEKGYIDVGSGTEEWLGITANRLKNAVAQLQEEGYEVHDIRTEQQGTGKLTTVHVLAAPGTTQKEVWEHKDEVQLPIGYSEDGRQTAREIKPPVSVDSNRIDIKYNEMGGGDKDGVIELRRGVDDISLGNANYAQVRIAVDGTHFLKGMAVYSDDLPDGVDIRFNTSKSEAKGKLGVMKEMKDDPINPFGASIKPDEKLILAQKHYIGEDGKEHQSALNIVNEEGDWGGWNKTLSSQFLSKQSPALAKQQLDLKMGTTKEDLNDILKVTNPTVKQKLLEDFADQCDSEASHLAAASLPRQSTRVILPMTGSKESEAYAPGYRDGEQLALIRYPHGGTFEIATVTVNNKNANAKKVFGDSTDMIGISPKAAKRLSGADFDGDTVVAIPTNNVKIKTSTLKGLENFDPHDAKYQAYDGMHVMTKHEKGIEMGKVSNLITDMTLKGASPDELARAVRHSMVVIDAEKHKLNYKLSEQLEGIKDLKAKYQGGPNGGASTLISRAGADVEIPERREKALGNMTEKELADWKAGKMVYENTNKTKKSGKRAKDGSWVDTIVGRTQTVSRMDLYDNAYDLVSGGRGKEGTTRIEQVYADHANGMKALAQKARAEARKLSAIPYSPSAAKTYEKEVTELKAALSKAKRNAPLERQAQLLADKNAKNRIYNGGITDKDHKKRIKAQELDWARKVVGAKKETINITDRQWEAISRGAVSKTFLSDIINNANPDRVRELATPRSKSGMSSGKIARAKSMLAKGYTQAEVADMLSVSTSTLVNEIGLQNIKSLHNQ